MATFVHFAPASAVAAIRRNGISPGRNGIFAFPVVPDFRTTHQWLREMRRGRRETLIAVYFRVPDGERLTFGRFKVKPEVMTAVEAVAAALSEPTAGFEIVISRRIRPPEIKRIKAMPQVTGWRYYPEAKGRAPFHVPQGQYGAARWRKAIKAREAKEEAAWLHLRPDIKASFRTNEAESAPVDAKPPATAFPQEELTTDKARMRFAHTDMRRQSARFPERPKSV